MRQRIIFITAFFFVMVVALFAYFFYFDDARVISQPSTSVASAEEPAPADGSSQGHADALHALEITVLEAGASVSGAKVFASLKAASSPAFHPGWVARKEIQTDATGSARLQVQAGSWFVLVQKDGFADAVQDVVVTADTRITISMERGFDVMGLAVDTEGHAIAPAQIRAIPLGDQTTKRKSAPEGEKSVAAETNGSFRLSRLSRGWWRLEGESEGSGRSEARVVSVPAAEPIVLVFRPSGFIEGVVVDREGKPAAHATVSIVGENEATNVDTSGEGAFSVERQPGAYRLSARLGKRVGSTVAPTFVRARATASTRITLEGEGATLRGQVLRDDGAPVANATILVSHALQAILVAEARSDENGRWELSGLPPGTVDIEASFGGMSSAQEVGFHLIDGAIVDVNLTLARLGSVEGTVVDGDRRGVAAQVTLRGKYEQFPQRQLLTTSSGQFTFDDVPSGEVLVHATLSAEDSGTSASARVEAGATTKLSLTLPSRKEFQVEVDRADCKAIEAVALKAFEPDAPRASIETLVPANEQRVALKLRPGNWILRAASGTPTSCAGSADVVVAAVESSRSNSIRLVPLPPRFQVTVLEATDDPAPGAQVSVAAKDGSQLRAETDLDGRATFAMARAMVTSLSARKEGRSARWNGSPGASSTLLKLSPAAHLKMHIVGHQHLSRVNVTDSDGEFLPVEATTAAADVYLAEVPAGVLNVRVSNADDTRFGVETAHARAGETTEVTVNLKGIGFLVGLAHLPESAQGQARVAVTSSLGTMIEPLHRDGHFKLGPMPEDEYAVEVRCTGCTWVGKQVQVGPGQEARVEFQ